MARHRAQTNADIQRRITESYSKAVSQLASDKIEERLGGIYTLERISRESPSDYWTIMETLTAFVRERARWQGPETDASETTALSKRERQRPPTDVVAVLTVIMRRREADRQREKKREWRINLSNADLRGAHLMTAHLEGAIFERAHLERASFREAHLERANFWRAHLEGAILDDAHLEGADLVDANLEDALLRRAHLEGTNLRDARFHDGDLAQAFGDAETTLQYNRTRPARWPNPR